MVKKDWGKRKRWDLNSIAGWLFAGLVWISVIHCSVADCSSLLWNHHEASRLRSIDSWKPELLVQSLKNHTEHWALPKSSSLLALDLLWFLGLCSSSGFEFQTWLLSKTLRCGYWLSLCLLTDYSQPGNVYIVSCDAYCKLYSKYSFTPQLVSRWYPDNGLFVQ